MMALVPPFGPGVSFVVVDQRTVEVGGLVTTIAHPIIIPVRVDTLRLRIGRPVEGRHCSGLNLDRGDGFLCERSSLNRARPAPTLGQGFVQFRLHVF
jgi:hypothetical protein